MLALETGGMPSPEQGRARGVLFVDEEAHRLWAPAAGRSVASRPLPAWNAAGNGVITS